MPHRRIAVLAGLLESTLNMHLRFRSAVAGMPGKHNLRFLSAIAPNGAKHTLKPLRLPVGRFSKSALLPYRRSNFYFWIVFLVYGGFS